MRKRSNTMREKMPWEKMDELEQVFKNTLREELWVNVYDLNELKILYGIIGKLDMTI